MQLYGAIQELIGNLLFTDSDTNGHQRTIDSQLAQKYPLRILLAEDNLVNQRLALKLFHKMGYNADLAANGIEAVEAIHRQQYDLVFMDIQMPEMDGFQATEKIIEAFPPDKRPRIIAMTGNRPVKLSGG